MSSIKYKYVRLEDCDVFIFFPEVENHSAFKYFRPVSTGFCFIEDNEVICFGRSESLNLESFFDDSERATKQMFGIEAALAFLKKEKEKLLNH